MMLGYNACVSGKQQCPRGSMGIPGGQVLHLMAFMGEQWHDSSHKLLADTEQHHAHCVCQLVDAAAGLQADFMVAVITTVLKNLSDLSSIWCNCLQEVLIRQSTSDLLHLMLVKASM